ncbi:unnamed protein product [Tilletia caries]|nr:unnamed protein product [Tilletia caries]CAD6981328.1 unnamed protein product [Tilletia controversa]
MLPPRFPVARSTSALILSDYELTRLADGEENPGDDVSFTSRATVDDMSIVSRGTSRAGDNEENAIDIDSDEATSTASHQRKDTSPAAALDPRSAHQPTLGKASVVYLNFGEPQLSNDRNNVEFPCRCCKTLRLVRRPLSDSGTSNLWSHAKRYNPNYERLGQPTVQEMFDRQQSRATAKPLSAGAARQMATYWVTEASRPISIVEDKGFRAFLTADQLRVMPMSNTVSRDITNVFKGMHHHMVAELGDVTGSFHIATDVWTSANGYAFLGIVICYQKEVVAVRRVLEMVPFNEKHDAVNLANNVYRITEKYGVTSRVWNIVSDNASENNAMIPLLVAKGGLPRYDRSDKNLSCRVRCCAHILNLITKAVLKDFDTKKKASDAAPTDHDDDEDDRIDWSLPGESDEEDDADFEDEDAESRADVDEGDDPNAEDSGPIENEDDYEISAALNPEAVANQDEDEQLNQIIEAAKKSSSPSSPYAVSASQQREINVRNKELGQVIKKIAWLATTLRRSGVKRRQSRRHCKKMGCDTPHTLLRDVATRWDSVTLAAERAIQLFEGIISFSEQPGSPIPKDKRLRRSNVADLTKLVQMLKPISQATKRFSEKVTPTIGDVIGLFEDIDKYFVQLQAQETSDDDAMWKQAAARGRAVTAKYYGLTEQANVISLATLLHPNFRKYALTLLKWPAEWQTQAEKQLRDVFNRWYATRARPEEARTDSQTEDFDQLDSMSQQLIMLHQRQRAVANPNEAIDDWLKEKITPLGPKWKELTPYAGATSVDVERLFSRAGHVVTPLRHKLKADKIGEIVTLGKWFTEGSVPDDLLVNILEAQQRTRKARRAKRKASSTSIQGPSKRSKGKSKMTDVAMDEASLEEESSDTDGRG